jgi:hypothetical protein
MLATERIWSRLLSSSHLLHRADVLFYSESFKMAFTKMVLFFLVLCCVFGLALSPERKKTPPVAGDTAIYGSNREDHDRESFRDGEGGDGPRRTEVLLDAFPAKKNSSSGLAETGQKNRGAPARFPSEEKF